MNALAKNIHRALRQECTADLLQHFLPSKRTWASIGRRPHKVVPRTKTKYPGITRIATELGVTREHLWRVLEGERESQPLLARYAVAIVNRKP